MKKLRNFIKAITLSTIMSISSAQEMEVISVLNLNGINNEPSIQIAKFLKQKIPSIEIYDDSFDLRKTKAAIEKN